MDGPAPVNGPHNGRRRMWLEVASTPPKLLNAARVGAKAKLVPHIQVKD